MSERKCTGCRGSLLPEWGEFKRCPTCREAATARMQKLRRSAKYRRKENALKNASRNAEADKARLSKRYMARKVSGFCPWCPSKAADDSVFCVAHRDAHRAASLAHYHRIKSGKKRPARRPVVRLTTRMIGRPNISPSPREPTIRDRVVQAIARFDEATNRDLQEATGISGDRLSTLLRQLRLSGRVERVRGSQGDVESAYRIARKEAA